MKKDLESTSSDLVDLVDSLEFHVPAEARETEPWRRLDGQLRKMIHGLRELAEQVRGDDQHDDSDSEVELQLHLGLMEARDRWQTVQPHVTKIKDGVLDTGQKVGQVVRDSLGDLEEALRRLDESEAERAEQSKRDWEKTRESARKLAQKTLGELRESIRALMLPKEPSSS